MNSSWHIIIITKRKQTKKQEVDNKKQVKLNKNKQVNKERNEKPPQAIPPDIDKN